MKFDLSFSNSKSSIDKYRDTFLLALFGILFPNLLNGQAFKITIFQVITGKSAPYFDNFHLQIFHVHFQQAHVDNIVSRVIPHTLQQKKLLSSQNIQTQYLFYRSRLGQIESFGFAISFCFTNNVKLHALEQSRDLPSLTNLKFLFKKIFHAQSSKF